jgi:hypothetical protein
MTRQQIRKALHAADWARVAAEPGSPEHAKADAEVTRLWKLMDAEGASAATVRAINR